ncbi:Fur family transcriptional regulator [Streptomyces sp. NRRL S-337]|uniref:Fur family transcriptional regulator n=1 Tax=Streptomyces sp. NRRL S-337 TaxID=1463900 RepID=UPI00099B931F|nr:Fur family transcriptional regulator [Streptomyces sp. NRRL S-337]
MNDLAPRCAERGRLGGRTTRQRSAVLRVLDACTDFVSAQALHDRLATTDLPVGLATVYRTLRELERAGCVDVVRDETGERRYRRRPDDGHRHYLICRACGRSRPVESEAVEEWAEHTARITGYAAVEHIVELTGICARCRPDTAEGEA